MNNVVTKQVVLPVKQQAVQASKQALHNISTNNAVQMNRFLQQLVLKAYSPSTIRTYRNEFAQLLQALRLHNVQALQPAQLQRYLLWCIKKRFKRKQCTQQA